MFASAWASVAPRATFLDRRPHIQQNLPMAAKASTGVARVVGHEADVRLKKSKLFAGTEVSPCKSDLLSLLG